MRDFEHSPSISVESSPVYPCRFGAGTECDLVRATHLTGVIVATDEALTAEFLEVDLQAKVPSKIKQP